LVFHSTLYFTRGLHACALEPDLEMLQDGESVQTFGANGMNPKWWWWGVGGCGGVGGVVAGGGGGGGGWGGGGGGGGGGLGGGWVGGPKWLVSFARAL